MFLGARLAILLSLARWSCEARGDRWGYAYKTHVEREQLNNFIAKEEVLGVNSQLICAMMADRKQWPTLSCYEGSKCALSSFMVSSNKSISGLNDPVRCFTKFSKAPSCFLPNGTEVLSGGLVTLSDCRTYVCTNKILVLWSPIRANATMCPSTYEIVEGLGCIKMVQENLNWCEARKRCFEKGSDLVNLQDHPNDVKALVQFIELKLKSADDPLQNVWIGLYLNPFNLMWDWTNGNQIENTSAVWNPGEPNDNIPCTGFSLYSLNKVNGVPCYHLGWFICQIPGF